MSSNKDDIAILIRLFKKTKPYLRVLLITFILAILIAPLKTASPFLINLMVDSFILTGDQSGLFRYAMIFIAVLIITVVFQYWFAYLSRYIGQLIVRDMRTSVFDHLTKLRLRYFDQTPIGTSTTRTINDIETISAVFTKEGVLTMVSDMLTVLAVLIVMLYTSLKLTLICLIFMPFMVLAAYIFKEKVKKAFEKVRSQISRMNAFLQERISGMKTIQIFNTQEQEADKFRQINRQYTQANLNTILYYAIFFPVVEIISASALALMVWWGARDVLGEGITIGTLIAFPMYINQLFRPIRFLADKFNTVQMSIVAGHRVFRLLDNKNFIPNPGHLKPEKLQGHIKFEHVHFSYDGSNPILKDISFSISAGQILALVGHTGSGKTSLINVLCRLYPFEKGLLTIDGKDILQYDLYALRRRMGIVMQDVFLFTGSILDNIRLMDSSITEEAVVEASKMIGAHQFISELPHAYDHQVLERGGNLSVGQRQLISFIRAIVFDPDILILDEATSSIDSESESIIQNAIEKLIKKRTCLIIAHRLSTIRQADKILMLDQGEIIERGTPDELLSRNGRFRALYELQFESVE